MKVLKELGIIFKTIKLKNFMSFGNIFTTVSLDETGTTLIIGENLDNGASSGAGKSTLINALSYCLYDKIPSNVSKDKLINTTNGKKNTMMEVELSFSKDEDEYIVRRWRGCQTGVQLLLNGLDVTPASVNRGEDSFNSKIEEILGFSYNLFSQIILFNGNSTPFLDLSVGSQRALIEELFRITMLSRKAIALKKMIVELEKDISMKKLLIQQQQKQNDTHHRHVSEAADRITKWDTQCSVELDKIQNQLEASASVDFDTEESILGEIVDLQNKIAAQRSEIRELTAAEISEVREIAAAKQSEIRELQTEKSAKERETSPKKAALTISHIEWAKLIKDNLANEKELEHLRASKCPYCLQKVEDADVKIADIESKNEANKSEMSLLTEKIAKDEAEIEEFNLLKVDAIAVIDKMLAERQIPEKAAKTSKRQELIVNKTLDVEENQVQLNEILGTLTFKNLGELLKAKNELNSLQNRLESMVVEVNPHTEAHEVLVKEGEITIDMDGLNDLITVQEHQQFLLKLLTDKNSFIRKNIISKTIPFLNKRIAFYTEQLNLPHIVSFQSDMTCEIMEIGRDLDHGNLSNGEKKKLNLSLCLSFRDVLTYLHTKVNVLFTDEVDGGSISGIDIDSLITTLKTKAWEDDIGIFIISHKQEFDGQCDNNITIRKEGGFSSLILQPDS